jgi:hypothetical protein
VDRKNGVLFWARVFYSPFFNPSLSSQNTIKALDAEEAELKAKMRAFNVDADPGDAGAGAVNPPTACGPADKPRCMGRPRDNPTGPRKKRTVIIGAPPRDRSKAEEERHLRNMKQLARPMEVLKCPNWGACSLFLVIMRAVVPAFKAATDKILAEDTGPTREKLKRTKNIVAAMHLFDDLPPEYQPKITMDSAWEAVRDVFNAFRKEAGKPPLCVDDVKSMLENKGGCIGWVAKRDVFEEKEMFTGGWRLMDGKVTVGGMVDGNAAKELPPAVRVTFGSQSKAQWHKQMSMLKDFDGYTKLLGGGNIPSSKLRCVYRALRAHGVEVETDDDCSILWSKVVSTATRRPVGAEEASELVKQDAVNRPYKINVDADKGDVDAVKALLAEVLSRAKDLVREDKG